MPGVESLAGWFILPGHHRPGRAALVTTLAPGESAVVADVQEPGCFRHLTCTATPQRLRDLVLEAWWDDEAAPSVECPLPDFFGIGHGGHNAFAGDLRSLLLYVAPRYGFNSYFPMPFARRGCLRLRNDGAETISGIHFQADFHRYVEPVETPLRFHAVWRRACPAYRRAAPLTVLEARGAGYLAGLVYHVHKIDDDDRWTHGGGDLLFLDGLDDSETSAAEASGASGAGSAPPHFLHGDGGEDYYGGAWGLYPSQGTFAGAHHAHPIPGLKDGRHSWEQHEDGRYSMYRWYVDFPIRFERSLRLAFGTEANEISATAYWYQAEPHRPLSPLPPLVSRLYGAVLSPDDGECPLLDDDEWPVAILGPFRSDATPPWTPEQAAAWQCVYETDVQQPYQDVTGPPWQVRWQMTQTRQHFLDFQAIHRSKRRLTVRGLAGCQRLPIGIGTYVAAALHSRQRQDALLEVGFEDRLAVWLNRGLVGEQTRPRPLDWGVVRLPITLDAGRNDLTLWLTNDRAENWSGWAASLRLRAPSGGPLPGVVAHAFPDLPPTLEYWREPLFVDEAASDRRSRR